MNHAIKAIAYENKNRRWQNFSRRRAPLTRRTVVWYCTGPHTNFVRRTLNPIPSERALQDRGASEAPEALLPRNLNNAAI